MRESVYKVTVFSDHLEAKRAAAGLSQGDLGDLIGTSQQNVGRWINAENLPERKWLKPIATAFDDDVAGWIDLWNQAAVETGERPAATDRQRDREIEKLRKDLARLSARLEKIAGQ